MKIRGNILFKETQPFNQKWLWWLILACMLSATGIVLWLAISETQKTKMPWAVVALFVPLEAIILYLFYVARLDIVVSTEGVYYRWRPFQKGYNYIRQSDMREVMVRKGPALQYGYHWIPGYGRVHTTGPGQGLQFVLKSGKKIFIGSQQPVVFSDAVRKLVPVADYK